MPDSLRDPGNIEKPLGGIGVRCLRLTLFKHRDSVTRQDVMVGALRATAKTLRNIAYIGSEPLTFKHLWSLRKNTRGSTARGAGAFHRTGQRSKHGRCKLSDYIIRQQLREVAERIEDGRDA